jgi:hypothetical protein
VGKAVQTTKDDQAQMPRPGQRARKGREKKGARARARAVKRGRVRRVTRRRRRTSLRRLRTWELPLSDLRTVVAEIARSAVVS